MLSAPALDLLISGWLDCPGCGRAGRILQLLTSTSHPPSFSEWWVHLRIQTLQTSSDTNPILTLHQWQGPFALVLEESRPRWGSRDCCLPAQKHLWEQQLPLLLSRLRKKGGWLLCVLTNPTGFSRPPGSEGVLKALYKRGVYQAACKGTQKLRKHRCDADLSFQGQTWSDG